MRTKQQNQWRQHLLTVISSTSTMWFTCLWFPNTLENLKILLCGQVVKIHSSEKCTKKIKFLKWIKYFNGLETKKLHFRFTSFLMRDGRTKGRPQQNAESAIFFAESISRDAFTTFCKLLNPWSAALKTAHPLS